MEVNNQNKSPVAYRTVSYIAISCFIGYWIITLLMVGLSKTLKKISPKTHYAYNLTIRQNWHLFSNPSKYNKHVFFVIRQKNKPQQTDTLDITRYFIDKRIAKAPFNNYYDNLDHVLFRISHYLEAENIATINKLKKQDSLQTNFWYIVQSSKITATKQPPIIHYTNLIGMCKQVLLNENIDTTAREYQLLLKNIYIPPHKLSDKAYDVENRQVVPCFVSPYFSFKKND
ncbi:MAG: hypothetical protein ACOVMM_04800 [Chitinophagaceae bacterium]